MNLSSSCTAKMNLVRFTFLHVLRTYLYTLVVLLIQVNQYTLDN